MTPSTPLEQLGEAIADLTSRIHAATYDLRVMLRQFRLEEARDTERRHLARSVTTYVDEDGMVVLRTRLTPELGAVVQRALEAAAERLYQETKNAR